MIAPEGRYQILHNIFKSKSMDFSANDDIGLQGTVVNCYYLGFLRQILRTSDMNQDSWRSILRISGDDGLGKPKYFIILEKL